jgi:uncharacterized surface protein with fasciclin (FAS1) repeats
MHQSHQTFRFLSRICHSFLLRSTLLSTRSVFNVCSSTVTAIAALNGCATASAPVSVADTVAATPQLSTLNDLIARAGLSGMLKEAGPFTVFAPTNEAFAKVPAKTMSDLAAHPDKLKAVLAYHVVPGKVMAADV